MVIRGEITRNKKSCFLTIKVRFWDLVLLSILRCLDLGGESIATNCQILQTRVNRLKSNKQWIDKAELEGFSCDIKFTGTVSFSDFFSLYSRIYIRLSADIFFLYFFFYVPKN